MKLLGEYEYELAGEKFKLKPTFEAMIEIEEITGLKCTEILDSITKRKFSVKEAVACLYCGMKGANGGKEVMSKEDVFQRVASDGLFKHFRAGLLITSVLTGTPLEDFQIVEKDGQPSVVVDDKKK
jgi:hypothetical protein